jgi:hypothetical protein
MANKSFLVSWWLGIANIMFVSVKERTNLIVPIWAQKTDSYYFSFVEAIILSVIGGWKCFWFVIMLTNVLDSSNLFWVWECL